MIQSERSLPLKRGIHSSFDFSFCARAVMPTQNNRSIVSLCFIVQFIENSQSRTLVIIAEHYSGGSSAIGGFFRVLNSGTSLETPARNLMIRNYLLIAFRTLTRNREYAIISVSGVAVAIASCL